MKKIFSVLFIFLLILSSTFTFAATPECYLKPMQPTDDNIYIGIPYTENSTDGYEVIESGSNIKYKQRIRHIKLISTDLNLYKSNYIFSLYNGQTKTVSETFTDSKTTSTQWSTSVSASYSFKLIKSSISASITSTLTKNKAYTSTYTITKGTSYSFPKNAPADVNYCKLYSGFCHDIYEVLIDYIPYEIHEKKTKVTGTYLPYPKDYPPGEEPALLENYDFSVTLEDGRTLNYHLDYARYNRYPERIPEVRNILMQFEDGYYHETFSGYNYNKKEVFEGIIRKPIPFEKFEYCYQ